LSYISRYSPPKAGESCLNKISPKSELEHWKDTYLEASNNLNNASKSDKIITELLNKTTDLEDKSVEDKKRFISIIK
jgi:hypothetical protein